uniref:Uncharacterized protein n=1 Tax=Chelydra serpentina TaxID=8475 RepID=A0A8C3RK14_CHESE
GVDVAGAVFQSAVLELTCSVCKDYFKAPVSLDCGHNFCQACITQWWEGLHTNFRCPECRRTFSQRNFKPNRQLRNIVEASRTLTLESTNELEVRRVCEKHNEDLKVFCQEDQTPICLVCHLSRDHREHTVVPIEEAAREREQKHKTDCIVRWLEHSRIFLCIHILENIKNDQIQSRLEILKKEKEEILSFKLSGKTKSQELLVGAIITQKQMCRAGSIQEWGGRLSHSPAGAGFVTDTIRPCPRAELCPSRSDSLSAANVTLDPDTAQPELILSADRRSVRCGDTRQDLPNNPERFDTANCVLGCEGFTSGSRYWEVEVEAEGWGVCAVGVSRESVSRKGLISLAPEQGIWAMQGSEDQYRALTSPEQILPFPPSRAPRRIRVYLDYEGGQVAFFDAGTGDPIVTFLVMNFPRVGELLVFSCSPF